jgi:hypothetical protein
MAGLFDGALVAIIFIFVFGTLNLRAQIVVTALLAVVIFAELLIIVAIDRPFRFGQGTPTPLADVLADFATDGGTH